MQLIDIRAFSLSAPALPDHLRQISPAQESDHRQDSDHRQENVSLAACSANRSSGAKGDVLASPSQLSSAGVAPRSENAVTFGAEQLAFTEVSLDICRIRPYHQHWCTSHRFQRKGPPDVSRTLGRVLSRFSDEGRLKLEEGKGNSEDYALEDDQHFVVSNAAANQREWRLTMPSENVRRRSSEAKPPRPIS